MKAKLKAESRQLCLLPMEKMPEPPPGKKEEIFGLFAKLVLAAARNERSAGETGDEQDDEQAHG